MSAPTIGPVLCACSWRGELSKQASCPACGRAFNDRVTPERLVLLRAFAADPLTPRNRSMLARLVELGLVRATGPRPSGSDQKRWRAPLRPYAPTIAGWRVLDAADGLITEQTRHDVAASVARHANLGESE